MISTKRPDPPSPPPPFTGLKEEIASEEQGPARNTADFRIRKAQVSKSPGLVLRARPSQEHGRLQDQEGPG